MEDHSHKTLNLETRVYKGGSYEVKTLEGTIQLNAWVGYQSRQGDYNSIGDKEQSDGTVKLDISGDGFPGDPEITQAHLNAYNYLLQHQETIREAMLASLFAQYSDLQEQYGYDAEDAASIMPNVEKVSQFKSLIGLSAVHLLNVSKADMAYVGYEFGCTWDDEHGLGFMMHKDTVIEMGSADTSFSTWIAEDDLNAR